MRETARDLFDLAPCGYAVLDNSGLVLEANVELLRLLGRSADELVGRHLPELTTVGGRILFDTHIFPRLAIEGWVREIALDLVHFDGTRVPVLLSANRLPSETQVEGNRTRAVILEARDRRRYETDLLEPRGASDAARRDAAELAQTLQQTLIPPVPPVIEGLAISAAYRPAGDGRIVGGDFYDVFQVSERDWMVMIGDVTGKGVAAAAVTAFVRHKVRDLAMQVRDPADLLHELNAALLAHPTERFCTLVVARLSDDGEHWSMTGSVGGHPLPLLRRADGTIEEVGSHGSLVGVLTEPRFATFDHVLADDLVVLYTDGVTEARRERTQFGLERLTSVVSATEHDVGAVTAAVVEAALDFQAGNAIDDIAVLTLAREALTPGED